MESGKSEKKFFSLTIISDVDIVLAQWRLYLFLPGVKKGGVTLTGSLQKSSESMKAMKIAWGKARLN